MREEGDRKTCLSHVRRFAPRNHRQKNRLGWARSEKKGGYSEDKFLQPRTLEKESPAPPKEDRGRGGPQEVLGGPVFLRGWKGVEGSNTQLTSWMKGSGPSVGRVFCFLSRVVK